jgi:hypothetical protein
VVAKAIDRPTDDDFIDRIKRQMRRYHRSEDIEAARFVVRGMLEPSANSSVVPASIEGKKLIRHRPSAGSSLGPKCSITSVRSRASIMGKK